MATLSKLMIDKLTKRMKTIKNVKDELQAVTQLL